MNACFLPYNVSLILFWGKGGRYRYALATKIPIKPTSLGKTRSAEIDRALRTIEMQDYWGWDATGRRAVNVDSLLVTHRLSLAQAENSLLNWH